MRISIEFFLLDNALMNFATLALAAALSGLRLRKFLAIALCGLGAVFALLALWIWPVLLTVTPKLVFAGILALGFHIDGWQGYLRGYLCILLCAILLGGLLLAVTLWWTGDTGTSGMVGGVLVGTVALRAALAAAALAALLPRLLRQLRIAARANENRIPMRITIDGRQIDALALLDTGNLLVEPVSSLPVVLLSRCPAFATGYPVRYCGVGGEGELTARRSKRAEVRINGIWRDIDVMVARAPQPIVGADAILGSSALPPREVRNSAKNKGEIHGA